MTVIIPHPDDELKIVNFQKELSEIIYNKTNSIFFKHFPLWIPLETLSKMLENNKNDTNIKNLLQSERKIIKKVTLGKLQLKNNEIFVEVTVSTKNDNNEEYLFEKLSLLKAPENNNLMEIGKVQEINELLNDYSRTSVIKIFRIGAVHRLSANSASISDSIWIKLK